MNKEDFLQELDRRIAQLPQSEREKSAAFYAEMLDDMTEDGMTEEAAVARLGSVEKIAQEILLDAPLTTLVKSRTQPRHRMQAWEVVLIVLGAVVWLPLLIAVAAVVFGIYLAIWAVLICLFGLVLGLALTAVAIPLGILFTADLFVGPAGIALGVGAMLILAGFAVLVFVLAVKLAKPIGKLAGAFVRWIKSLLIRKERVQ